jgi:hypothetical protein
VRDSAADKILSAHLVHGYVGDHCIAAAVVAGAAAEAAEAIGSACLCIQQSEDCRPNPSMESQGQKQHVPSELHFAGY